MTLETKPHAIIFDIDGTLADCSHRRQYVDGSLGKKDLVKFYAGCGEDTPKPFTTRLLCGLLSARGPWDEAVILVSGRPNQYREITSAWLQQHFGFIATQLFMRPDGDYTPDDQLKERIYRNQIEPYYGTCYICNLRQKLKELDA